MWTKCLHKIKRNFKSNIDQGFQIFEHSGVFHVPKVGMTVRALVIGGGSAGYCWMSCGAGGASGYANISSLTLLNKHYYIAVGSGGFVGDTSNGGNSSFGTLVEVRGGISSQTNNGSYGGSGGGAVGVGCNITFGGSGGSDGYGCDGLNYGGKGQVTTTIQAQLYYCGSRWWYKQSERQ